MVLSSAMEQRIEPPNEADVNAIAKKLVLAGSIVADVMGKGLSGGMEDIELLQGVLDAKVIEREATLPLQALGIALGKVFVENNHGYDWWMVEDEYGRDPCVRYKETTLLVFPATMISKRVEDGDEVDVARLYRGLKEQLEEIRRENYPEE